MRRRKRKKKTKSRKRRRSWSWKADQVKSFDLEMIREKSESEELIIICLTDAATFSYCAQGTNRWLSETKL